ncbi:MAG: glycosyltransferase [Verrucomicrobiales bacterium]|nr:glycosyltransferase [Verrucomicrobiales bacterium]
MTDQLPTVSVIVAARPEQADLIAVGAARALDYPKQNLELLVSRGRQPSAQRNAALKIARGELVYFLDDDSAPAPANLRRAIAHFADPDVQVVGGPSICPPKAPFIELVFALVLSSWLAFGPSRARYAQVGTVRATTEKELILCNLLARKQTLVALGGFNEALYPNEENALMDAVQARGGKLVYDPELVVYRRPRRTLRAFAKMLFTYGRGRAEQFRVYPTFGSALNFVPPVFCFYLAVALPLTLSLGVMNAKIVLGPLAVYGVALCAQAIGLIARGGFLAGICAAPLVALTHVLYGLGFWRGLFTKLAVHAPGCEHQVVVETVTV